MDVFESKKQFSAETTRPPLVSADNKNGTTNRPRFKEVSSRYRLPNPTREAGPKRYPSPNAAKISSASSLPATKRSVSAERKLVRKPSPPRSSSPSTPVEDTNVEKVLSSRKVIGNKLPESLWPSTMRSLSVAFQSDTFSLPVSKREKPLTDRALRQSSNVALGQGQNGQSNPVSRKVTPERKRSLLNGKVSTDQSENARPVDSRRADQQRWPSRTGTGSLSLRRLSLDGTAKPLQISPRDFLTSVSSDGSSVDDNLLLIQQPHLLNRTDSANPALRSESLPAGFHVLSSYLPRGVSPSRSKAVNSSSFRGHSPGRVRSPSPSKQPPSPDSVLSYIVDIRRGQKVANQIEDVHQLRMLYNRHLQWRHANALADVVLDSQKEKAEIMLYSVWRTNLSLWNLVIRKRMELQQLRLKLKLYSILNNQATSLDEWASVERDHTKSLSWVIQDLQACTLRIPVSEGAKGEIGTIRDALASALEVVQTMGSSLCSVVSPVEGMNSLVSELADVASLERRVLDECELLMSSTVAMQVEECSLRTSLLQLKNA